jgi:hypothetical protein
MGCHLLLQDHWKGLVVPMRGSVSDSARDLLNFKTTVRAGYRRD